MPLVILGDHPLARDSSGKLKSRIGTVFPRRNVLVTLRGIHATQRAAYLDMLRQERQQRGETPPSPAEESREWAGAVDLIVEDDAVLIRPDPDNMPLAFRADEVLQELVAKHKIKFLHVLDQKVYNAIKRRGECWRMTALPKSRAEIIQKIAAAKIAVGGREIYYYSDASGTRLLTCQEFAQLADLDDAELRRHLVEVQELLGRNRNGGDLECAPFMAGEALTAADFAAVDFAAPEAAELRRVHAELARRFAAAVPPEFRRDDPGDVHWRNQMYAALIGQEEAAISEESLLGLSSEFFMQVRWLPGGRIEEGEMIIDPVFERPDALDDPELGALCDEKCRGFIFNFVREYGNLEYVNIGRVIGSLTRRPALYGRRDVYVAVVKLQDSDGEIVNILRMQKWGIQEHLDHGKDLLDAILESEEYTDYIFNRRLGCRQLGMNLPPHVTHHRIRERYRGTGPRHHGAVIWSTYFQREYVRGIATDKMPRYRFADEAFALAFARLLGRAAAVNMVVGRCDRGGNTLFDDGDEVVIFDAQGLPADIVVADQTGTFGDYLSNLRDMTADYAAPLTRRAEWVRNPEAFADAYLDAFAERLAAAQQEYHKRKRNFDTLFRHLRRDEKGSFAYRWECVLRRLAAADPQELKELIRENVAAKCMV